MKKIKNSFAGILTGLIFLVVGTVLIWWNEGNNVKNIKTVSEVEKIVIDVTSDEIKSENEGKLIATNGKLVVNGEANDPVFNVTVNTAKLVRVVEYYQWQEESENDEDGNTRYSYKKVWSDTIIDSSNFHDRSHTNPTTESYPSDSYIVNDVNLGAFKLSSNQISNLETEATYYVTKDNEIDNYHIDGSYLTTAESVSNPKVGDVRISFKYNDWTEASVLAVQKGSSFDDYVSEVGKRVNRVEKGILSSDTMIQNMVDENNMMKWIFRGIGVIVIILGYLMIVNPISTIAGFVPILGDLVGGALAVVAFLVGLVHSLIVFAIAWFRFRPILSIILIVVVVAIIICIKKFTKSKNTKTA